MILVHPECFTELLGVEAFYSVEIFFSISLASLTSLQEHQQENLVGDNLTTFGLIGCA
jgi:hypothetical protein